MIAQVVARVMFLPSLAYNLYMEQTSERRWWDRVNERLILGVRLWKLFSHRLGGWVVLCVLIWRFSFLVSYRCNSFPFSLHSFPGIWGGYHRGDCPQWTVRAQALFLPEGWMEEIRGDDTLKGKDNMQEQLFFMNKPSGLVWPHLLNRWLFFTWMW